MIEKYKTIETILEDYKSVLGKDYSVYKNHIYRIFNWSIIFDDNPENIEKYAIASVFHDLGIWTHNFDYLKPSIQLVTAYLKKNKQEDWMEEISLIIDNHHKMSSYNGKFQQVVETFRKADWIDVTNGFKKHQLSKQDFKLVKSTFSNKGFHLFLVKQSLKWFVKHPFNPLPMFKK